jgi:voltage-gated potassium channel
MHLFYLLRKRTKRIRRALGNTLKYRILFLTGFLLLLMCLHVLAMMSLEGFSAGDAAWLTITTATTVGYGDISAATPAGRWATGLLMYAGGIFVLAQLAGLVFEAAQSASTQRLNGKIYLKGNKHIVIFGWRENFLLNVVKEIRASMLPLHEADIFIVSPRLDRLPEELRDLEVHHVSGAFYDPTTLEKASVETADRFIIIPDSDELTADFVSADLTSRLRELCPDTSIVVSCLRQNMEASALSMGAVDALTFDANYPDMLARAALSIGSESVVEELIQNAGAEMVIVQQPLISTVGKVLDVIDGRAILVGFRRLDGSYVLHPGRTEELEDEQLVFLVDVDKYGSASAAEAALAEMLNPLTDDRPILLFAEPKRVGLIGSNSRVSKQYLRRLDRELRNVEIVHLSEDCWAKGFGQGETEDLTELDAIILLTDSTQEPKADAKTFLAIRFLRDEQGYKGRIIAEAVIPENRGRFEAAGANDVLRPVTRNLDILARCVLTGAEEVLDSLYSSYGTQELVGIEVDTELVWGALFAKLYDLGLPLAFKDGRGFAVVPKEDYSLGKGRLYILMEKTSSIGEVKRAVNRKMEVKYSEAKPNDT